MTAEKISVSLPREDLAWPRRQAKRQKTSVSASTSDLIDPSRLAASFPAARILRV